jgi:ElaB/YqjD/DUF883 family membrane-anchored ribosome-binding protein
MDQFYNQDVERNIADREQTRTALAQKLEALETRMRDNIEQVKETVRNSTDLGYQVDKRPWAMFGLSVALGCIAGRLIMGKRQTLAARSISQVENLVRQGSDQTRRSFEALAENLDLDHYANQLGALKKAAMAALVPLASEFVRNLVPAIVAQLDKYARAKNLETNYHEGVDRVRQEGERASDTIRSSVH